MSSYSQYPNLPGKPTPKLQTCLHLQHPNSLTIHSAVPNVKLIPKYNVTLHYKLQLLIFHFLMLAFLNIFHHFEQVNQNHIIYNKGKSI